MQKLLTLEQVALALGVSKKTLRRMIRARQFPDSFPTSPRKQVWLEQDVRAFLYLRSRIGPGRIPPASEEEPEGG